MLQVGLELDFPQRHRAGEENVEELAVGRPSAEMFNLGQLGGEGTIHPGQQLVTRQVLGRHGGVEDVDHCRPPGHGLQLLTINISRIFLVNCKILIFLTCVKSSAKH